MKLRNSKMLDIYTNKPGDYYAKQMSSRGLRSLWFKKRQSIVYGLVKKYWAGGVVLDIGCGNCLWHQNGIPTLGVDINEAMLKYNKFKLNSFSPLCADISIGLPVKSNSVDNAVIMEVLEHFKEPGLIINEVFRVLKPGGNVIISVPYGKLPGLWNLFFALRCKYKGLIEQDAYYLNRCGHVVSFNIKNLLQIFNKFEYLECLTLIRLTIFLVVKKAR
ncbi:MAG: class I SAM-dependent methyltransferase [Candidatus Omnitrophica bacterium]|nr:class I SAM-dependent methyltransferase [Candidatus Omnitrophota bacterium]